jgi:hypothetical protein
MISLRHDTHGWWGPGKRSCTAFGQDTWTLRSPYYPIYLATQSVIDREVRGGSVRNLCIPILNAIKGSMMLRKTLLVCLLMGLSVCIGGCLIGSETAVELDREPAEYLPLEVGRWWKYSIPGATSIYDHWKTVYSTNDGVLDWFRIAEFYVSSGDTLGASYSLYALAGDTLVVKDGDETMPLLRKPLRKGANWTTGNTHVNIVQAGGSLTTRAGTFEDVVAIGLTTSTSNSSVVMYLAPGVGFIQFDYISHGVADVSELVEYGTSE